MPTWRCPHCGTPQAETARCWVCRRSSTACGTCRHFRRAVAGQLGYCGLDRRRTPLQGDEIRACWEETQVAPGSPGAFAGPLDPPAPAAPIAAATANRLEFVDVRTGRPEPRIAGAASLAGPGRADVTSPDSVVAPPPAPPAAEAGWSLWGDTDL